MEGYNSLYNVYYRLGLIIRDMQIVRETIAK